MFIYINFLIFLFVFILFIYFYFIYFFQFCLYIFNSFVFYLFSQNNCCKKIYVYIICMCEYVHFYCMYVFFMPEKYTSTDRFMWPINITARLQSICALKQKKKKYFYLFVFSLKYLNKRACLTGGWCGAGVSLKVFLKAT